MTRTSKTIQVNLRLPVAFVEAARAEAVELDTTFTEVVLRKLGLHGSGCLHPSDRLRLVAKGNRCLDCGEMV
jgi:hypothetical protein